MLCGLQRSLKNYDPSTFDNELYLIAKKSKGYRKGFDDDFQPILGDDVHTPIIKKRILEIVRAFKEKGIVSEKELAELTPKTDTSESFMDKVVSSILHDILTGANKDQEIKDKESEIKELTRQIDSLKTDYNKLDDDTKKLRQNYTHMNLEYFNKILIKDMLNYVLLHFIKYCDARIGGANISDYQVVLMSLDKDSLLLFMCLYQDLTVEEWCSLMDRIQGAPLVQPFLDYCTSVKKVEVAREYNKENLFYCLMMFRVVKMSSSN